MKNFGLCVFSGGVENPSKIIQTVDDDFISSGVYNESGISLHW